MTEPSADRRPVGIWAAIVLGVPVTLYLLGFLVVVLDQFVFDCYLWLQMPVAVRSALVTIYLPLIWLVNQFFV